MKLIRRAWTLATYVAGGYAVYNQLKTLSQAKDDLYQTLTPEQRAQWESVFGKPVQVPTMSMPQVRVNAATPIEHLQSGT